MGSGERGEALELVSQGECPMYMYDFKLLEDDALFHVPSGFNDPPCPLVKKHDLRVQLNGHVFSIDDMMARKKDDGVEFCITTKNDCLIKGEFRRRPKEKSEPLLLNGSIDGEVEIFGAVPKEMVMEKRMKALKLADSLQEAFGSKVKKRKRISGSKAKKRKKASKSKA